MRSVLCSLLLLLSPLVVQGAGLSVHTSPAVRRINQLEQSLKKSPGTARIYTQLASAFCSRARETSDASFYRKAEAALQESLRLEPGNFEAEKTRVRVLLGKHEFRKALVEAERLRSRAPDDVIVYGYLVDANVELGNYKEAEEAAQWMLDLRPGNVPGLTRAAYLRELFGDPEGAVELMQLAYERTPPGESEDLAWILTQVGHLQLSMGKTDAAEKLLQRALIHFPRYHYALAQLARLRQAQKRFDEAVVLLRERYAAAPHPENLYQLASALKQAGRQKEAEPLFARFEEGARAEMEGQDNANRELIFYYAERDPKEALKIAERESKRRRDVYTLEAYAWALHSCGRHADAGRQIEKALSIGIRDPGLLYHASVIAGEED